MADPRGALPPVNHPPPANPPPTQENKFLQCHAVITGRNEVLAKVIFLHLSVIHSVHGGGGGVAT